MQQVFFRAFYVFAFLLLSSGASAQNRVVVIPMAGEDLQPLSNIVTVAKENGDFDDPIAAMNSIVDADENNPYLMVIAPGVYDLGSSSLSIKSWVQVAGSGPQATILKSTRSSSSNGAVTFSDNANLQDLSVVVSGTSTASQIGIGNTFAGKNIISNVHIRMDNENALTRTGYFVRITDSIIRDSIIEIVGGTNLSRGVHSSGAGTDLLLSDMIIALPNGVDNDPITFGAGSTVSGTCNFVIFKRGDRTNASAEGILLDSDCD